MASILEKIGRTYRPIVWQPGRELSRLPVLVLQQPTLAQRAHARLYSMIHTAGVRR